MSMAGAYSPTQRLYSNGSIGQMNIFLRDPVRTTRRTGPIASTHGKAHRSRLRRCRGFRNGYAGGNAQPIDRGRLERRRCRNPTHARWRRARERRRDRRDDSAPPTHRKSTSVQRDRARRSTRASARLPPPCARRSRRPGNAVHRRGRPQGRSRHLSASGANSLSASKRSRSARRRRDRARRHIATLVQAPRRR